MTLRVANLEPDGIFSSPESLMVGTMQVVVTTWWRSESKQPAKKIHQWLQLQRCVSKKHRANYRALSQAPVTPVVPVFLSHWLLTAPACC